ncbi:MAG: hypothetical protein H6Q51_2664, partial [Deltaproteobacteria bacterium]|nr:hypothetical protein [Deltaproteobacteria bacterium]
MPILSLVPEGGERLVDEVPLP